MIDLKQFEGHTEGPWKAYATDEGFVAVFPSKLLIKGEQDCIAVLSTIGNPSLPEIANRNLISSAPELLQEIKNLRHESFFLKQDIEEIEEREGEEIHSEKVWRSYVKEYFDSLDEMVQASKIELANSELSNDRFEKATQRLRLLAGLSPEKSTGAKLNFENGVFIEKDGRFD